MISVNMANKFPNSGTLGYHFVNSGKQGQKEKAHIHLKRHILMRSLGPGHGIALLFLDEGLPPRLWWKNLMALKAPGFRALPPGEL